MSGSHRQAKDLTCAAALRTNPKAHRIGPDEEALAVARQLAGEFVVEAAERDRERRLPVEERAWTNFK